jgi:glycerophosphoryl diester phosphodiesterase
MAPTLAQEDVGPSPSETPPDKTAVIIAHRTCPRHAAENSLEGIRRAAELGADGVEIDVQRTLDGVPILMHDRTLWRMAGLYWPARLLPYALLRRLRLKGGSERVPTLAQALAALPPGLTVAIEIKHASVAAATLAEVRQRGLEGRTLLWSKHASAVRYTAREAPEVESSLLRKVRWAGGLRRFLDDAVKFQTRGVSAHWGAINEVFLEEAHGRGLKVYSMSHDVESMAAKLALGLDGIVTDWPEEARTALQSSRRVG